MVSPDGKVLPRSGIFLAHQCPFPVLPSTGGCFAREDLRHRRDVGERGEAPSPLRKERRRGAIRSHTALLPPTRIVAMRSTHG